PTDALDFGRLARLAVSGGDIRNIALGAAFLAAEADQPVRMSHLLQAAKNECQKLERPVQDAEMGVWRRRRRTRITPSRCTSSLSCSTALRPAIVTASAPPCSGSWSDWSRPRVCRRRWDVKAR